MMKVEYINPFVSAAFSVLQTCIGDTPTKGQLSLRPEPFTSNECNILTGVAGMVEGTVIYSMSSSTADKVASAMTGIDVTSADQLGASAIAELGNMITGNAMTNLSQAGYICDITPPTLLQGKQVQLSTLAIPALVVPVQTQHGTIEITVSLRERK